VASDLTYRSILRLCLTIVAVAFTIYLIYRLRKPIGWVFLAAFLAVALSNPVNRIAQRMPRGAAIAVVFLALLFIPVGLGALLIPPIVEQATGLVDEAPEYARQAQQFVTDNERLRRIDADYQVFQKIEEEAAELPNRFGDAAGVLGDIGVGLVNSIFALVTILVLTAFMLGGGPRWKEAVLGQLPPDRRVRTRRVMERSRKAVGDYVFGMLLQATFAGITAYIVLTILGVPFREPLAALVFLLDLIPLVGATIASVVVGIVTLFTDFPTATIVWAVFAIVYQQIENTVIQPRIQQRAVNVAPVLVLISVLFGATLLGVVGALIAIPVAATIQIAVREYLSFRTPERVAAVSLDDTLPPPDRPADPPPPPPAGPAPAPG
jgi:predicted PurR-regulated permease PerM